MRRNISRAIGVDRREHNKLERKGATATLNSNSRECDFLAISEGAIQGSHLREWWATDS
jgi:hypothetical protein